MKLNKASKHLEDELLSFRFQERDGDILAAIQEYDGFLARRHLKYLFWQTSTWRAMEKRLAKLHQAGFIDWPDSEERRHYPIPEPVIWLDWKGALYLAGRQGVDIPIPERINENRLRLLDRSLRGNGFSWLREPRWSQMQHDLTITDIRFWLNDSLTKTPNLLLEEWIKESTFRSDPDSVTFQFKTRNGELVSRRKRVSPDGMFTLIDVNRRDKGLPCRARYLVEVDMATHDNPTFGNEKAAAGLAYLKSAQFQNRFGGNSGRWLILTTGETRMRNLIRQTEERIPEGANLFYFTTFSHMGKTNFLQSPIWSQAGTEAPCALLPEG